MKFFTSLVLSTMLVTAAFAQRAFIGTPTEGSSVKAGSNITVEVDRPDTLTGSTEVAIVIGILSCSRFSPQTCPPPTDIIGSVMYKGQYNPEFHTNVSASKPPHQNFTLTIPASMQKGPAQISLTHLSLVGAGPFPFFETQNVTVNVV
ncbi:hypothetical protein C8R43DRAFT_1008648 [Mycena crocata]|nr:hypothetical protein C8R43DRAFT_1008648 [Mycena crocata]